MKIDELLETARMRAKVDDPFGRFAQAVLELLDVSIPCGFPTPEVHPGEVYITREMPGRYEPDEAAAVAIALLRGAEKARERA